MNDADSSPGAWRRADIWIPFACGLSVLAFGYVALILFWSLGVRHVGLPGLFHYPDATWGDGLLLPVLGVLPMVSHRTAGKTAKILAKLDCLWAGGGSRRPAYIYLVGRSSSLAKLDSPAAALFHACR